MGMDGTQNVHVQKVCNDGICHEKGLEEAYQANGQRYNIGKIQCEVSKGRPSDTLAVDWNTDGSKERHVR